MSKATTTTTKRGKKKDFEAPEITNGIGAFLFSENCQYSGEWNIIEGIKKKHGKGKYTEGNNVYEGDFDNDEMHGQGKMTFASKAVYEGQLVRNKFEGTGKYTWPDKAVYEGEWKNNRMHGDGVYTSKDGKKWIGKFYNGNGEGLDRELIDAL
jgi:hypothetical protein